MAEGIANVSSLVVDCADPPSLAAFWQALLGGDLVPYPEFDVIALRAPGVTFDFVRKPGSQADQESMAPRSGRRRPGCRVTLALELGATRAHDVWVSEQFTVIA
jgi:hypothetical protein